MTNALGLSGLPVEIQQHILLLTLPPAPTQAEIDAMSQLDVCSEAHGFVMKLTLPKFFHDYAFIREYQDYKASNISVHLRQVAYNVLKYLVRQCGALLHALKSKHTEQHRYFSTHEIECPRDSHEFGTEECQRGWRDLRLKRFIEGVGDAVTMITSYVQKIEQEPRGEFEPYYGEIEEARSSSTGTIFFFD